MDVIALLIPNPESPLLELPGEDALDHGPMLAQAVSVYGVPTRDSGDDPSLPERFADLVPCLTSLVQPWLQRHLHEHV